MTDRVRKPEKFDNLLKLLKDEEKIFASYKDILVFAFFSLNKIKEWASGST